MTEKAASQEPQDELAEQLRKKQVSNILAKLKAGKVLSKREQDILDDYTGVKREPKGNNITERMPPLTATQVVEVTGFSRQRVGKALSSLTPVERLGRMVKYDPCAAIRTVIGSVESDKDRTERLRGDLLEVKIKRMNGESIDMKLATQVWTEILVRLSQAVQYLDGIDRSHAIKLCRQLKKESERIHFELSKCTFKEAAEDTETDEE